MDSVGRCRGAGVCISTSMQKIPGSKPGRVGSTSFCLLFSPLEKSFAEDKIIQIIGCGQERINLFFPVVAK